MKRYLCTIAEKTLIWLSPESFIAWVKELFHYWNGWAENGVQEQRSVSHCTVQWHKEHTCRTLCAANMIHCLVCSVPPSGACPRGSWVSCKHQLASLAVSRCFQLWRSLDRSCSKTWTYEFYCIYLLISPAHPGRTSPSRKIYNAFSYLHLYSKQHFEHFTVRLHSKV